jgi:hypothetical protein
VRFLRRHLPSLACLVLAALVGGAAIADHSWKQRRINRAETLEWYCNNRGIHCGGPSWEPMERSWNARQLAYEAAVVALAGFAVVRFGLRTVRR